jgi:hypothetical protein
MKVPLKIEVFMCGSYIVTEFSQKITLLRGNWIGSETCCFCDSKEPIQHLFFKYPFAKIVVYITFGLAPPKNITNLFGNWLKDIPKKDLIHIGVGVCVIIWTM